MKNRNQRRYEAAFKARVALDATAERESLAQLGQRYRVHPVLVGQWKKQLAERAVEAFRRDGSCDAQRAQDGLLRKIGELTMERDFLARGPGPSR